MHAFVNIELLQLIDGDPAEFTRLMVANRNGTLRSKYDEANVEMKMGRFARRPNLVNVVVDRWLHNT